MAYNDSAYVYQGLIEISKNFESALKDMNRRTIQLMQNEKMSNTMQSIARITQQYELRLDNSATTIANALDKAIPKLDFTSQQVARSLQSISDQYNKIFESYDFTKIGISARSAMEQLQLTTIRQLCLSYETTMIHDAITCLANAQYENLPNVFNHAMKQPVIGAADVAFFKTGKIVPILEGKLVYPRGFRSSLDRLNKVTAENISDVSNIEYDTKQNVFLSTDSEINSKGMNIVCAGIELFDSGELFSEVELMDFISFLSRTPYAAGLTETGKKIYEWLKEMFLQKTNSISFDKDVYYHCRSRIKGSMPYTYDEMMKAPHGLPAPGRFNHVGRAHFYFSNTKRGAESEVKKHLKKDEELQTVKIKPVKRINMLDLSHTLQRGASFLKMIRYPLRDDNNKMPKEYLLPCFVADCCKTIGFDGIKYYGSKEYDNYVSWTDGYFVDAGMCE